MGAILQLRTERQREASDTKMSSARTKYRAKHVFWDSLGRRTMNPQDIQSYRESGRLKLPSYIWRFDSTHEFKVYLELVRIFGAYRVVRQYALEVLPPSSCYPKGKTWRVDFAIASCVNQGGYNYYVEAKGAFLPEFATTLACLQLHNPFAFDKVHLVFPEKLPTTSKVLNSLKKTWHCNRLITLKELTKKQTLL